MGDFLVGHEASIRLSCFLSIFLVMGVWELLAPRRARVLHRQTRWPNNIAVVVINTMIVRILLPTTAVGLALWVSDRGWGLLNLMALPSELAIVVGVLLLDLAIYAQHVVFHYVPALWRLHRMHHTDLDFDVTTGARFHPIEIVLSMLIKFGLIGLLGPPALAVLIFEVLLNGTSMFNHSNVHIPKRIDGWLRCFVVTPDMHRVHHSVVRRETDSNFGFNLPWWDRIFGTYTAEPGAGHRAMTIGIEQFRDKGEARIDRMLTQPFRSDASPAGANSNLA